MAQLIELMGKDIYDLIYKHYDDSGNLISDLEDVLYCEDKDISQKRVEKLKALLKPVTNAKETLIPLEAAKLLAAWGVDEAIDYFEYCIDNRIDKLGNLSPHRLHGYDTTYEDIGSALIKYYSRCADRSEFYGKKATIRIQPLLKKIIQLSKEISYNLLGLTKVIKRLNWREYEDDLKSCYVEFLKRTDGNRNNYWNICDLKDLLIEWDPDFIMETNRNGSNGSGRTNLTT